MRSSYICVGNSCAGKMVLIDWYCLIGTYILIKYFICVQTHMYDIVAVSETANIVISNYPTGVKVNL